jgi:putative phosphoesterase
MPDGIHRIGLISDTHGLLRPEVHGAFAGVELILHAGDVEGDEILDELETIAAVDAVRGNCDPPGHPRLPQALARTIGGLRIHVSHGHEVGAPTPERLLARYDADVLVYGHTHRPLITQADGRLVVNPGAAGPRRFNLQPSLAIMTIASGRAEVELVSLSAKG